MIDINHIPQSFAIAHRHKESYIHISFTFIPGTTHPEWNGYYEDHRVLLRPTELEWICEVILRGVHLAIFRWPTAKPGIDELKSLASCAFYYIDSIIKKGEYNAKNS